MIIDGASGEVIGCDLPDSPPSRDGTPDWAYDEDGYCVCCGNGRWKFHMPECDLRDALDFLEMGRAGH